MYFFYINYTAKGNNSLMFIKLLLLKNCIAGSSKAKTFYLYLIHKHSHYNNCYGINSYKTYYGFAQQPAIQMY